MTFLFSWNSMSSTSSLDQADNTVYNSAGRYYKKEKRIAFVAREQSFRITVSGLQPTTTHYVYFERQLVDATKLKPVGGKIGDALATDANGKLTFDYYYDSGLPASQSTVTEARRLAALIAGRKELIITHKSTSVLPSDFESTYLSYVKTFIEVQVAGLE